MTICCDNGPEYIGSKWASEQKKCGIQMQIYSTRKDVTKCLYRALQQNDSL